MTLKCPNQSFVFSCPPCLKHVLLTDATAWLIASASAKSLSSGTATPWPCTLTAQRLPRLTAYWFYLLKYTQSLPAHHLPCYRLAKPLLVLGLASPRATLTPPVCMYTPIPNGRPESLKMARSFWGPLRREQTEHSVLPDRRWPAASDSLNPFLLPPWINSRLAALSSGKFLSKTSYESVLHSSQAPVGTHNSTSAWISREEDPATVLPGSLVRASEKGTWRALCKGNQSSQYLTPANGQPRGTRQSDP